MNVTLLSQVKAMGKELTVVDIGKLALSIAM
jgi:hypothetical protein